ncbi:MAG: hypothetical protein M3131_10430, partial [Actinomycetota bacterium]|nr:hypothetical protein [Actinomycetota bacterium]
WLRGGLRHHQHLPPGTLQEVEREASEQSLDQGRPRGPADDDQIHLELLGELDDAVRRLAGHDGNLGRHTPLGEAVGGALGGSPGRSIASPRGSASKRWLSTSSTPSTVTAAPVSRASSVAGPTSQGWSIPATAITRIRSITRAPRGPLRRQVR